MIWHRDFVRVWIGASLLAVAGCGSATNESAEVRYRVKVEIGTPDGIKSGSSVWSFKLQKPDLALASPFDSDFAGEAVAVDLENGRTLFALIKDQEMLPERHLRQFNIGNGGDRIANIRSIAEHIGATATLSCKPIPENGTTPEANKPDYDCPTFVTFADLADPKSVKQVSPADLSASFGKGYLLKSVTFEITDAPVTTGIEKRLKWLSAYPEPRLDRDYKGGISPSLPQLLSHGDFKRTKSK